MTNAVSTSTSLEDYTEATEYGYPESAFAWYARTSKYTWLGAKERAGDVVGGLVLMGARLYNPTTGLFLSRDPVPGGNDNAYTYPPDPINGFDLDGRLYRDFGPCGCSKRPAKHHVMVSVPAKRASSPRRPNKFSSVGSDQPSQQPVTKRHHGGPHDHDSHGQNSLGKAFGATGLAIGGSEIAAAGAEGLAGVSEAAAAGGLGTGLYVGGTIATGGLLVVGSIVIIGAFWVASK